MSDFYEEITAEQRAFIERQHLFVTATAHAEGRVNCSPKGMDTFRVLNSHEVAYLDMYGSGNETRAHLQNDGRITIMFCSFDQNPNILRLYGRGRAIRPTDSDWDRYVAHFDENPAFRQIMVITVESTQDSCGFAVPRYEFVEERTTLVDYCEKKYPRDVLEERIAGQTTSIDGLPITI